MIVTKTPAALTSPARTAVTSIALSSIALASIALPSIALTGIAVAPLRAAAAEVPLAAEHYTLALPLGWHEVGQQNQPDRSLIAYAPAGQNAAGISDLLTVESIPVAPGNPNKLTLQSTYTRMGGQYHSACVTSNIGKYQPGTVNGYDSAFWVVGCGERPGTGRGEVAFVHVIQGLSAIYVIERVWQTPLWNQEGPPISAADATNATDILKGFSVCDTSNPNHPCPAK